MGNKPTDTNEQLTQNNFIHTVRQQQFEEKRTVMFQTSDLNLQTR